MSATKIGVGWSAARAIFAQIEKVLTSFVLTGPQVIPLENVIVLEMQEHITTLWNKPYTIDRANF